MAKPPSAYTGSEPYIFVCYAHEDDDAVHGEIARLDQSGFRLWYDEGITPGSEWNAAIERCSVFLYLISPNSVASEHCRQEVNFALEQQCQMLAVHLVPTDVPSALRLSLSHRQAILKYKDDNYAAKLDAVLESALAGDVSALTPAMRDLKIGEYVLDLDAQRLTGEVGTTALDPKDVSVLLHLVEAAPGVVSTEELLTRSWPGTVVGDNAVQQVITRLRKAFGDDARNPTYIETLPRRGYRLLTTPISDSPTRHRMHFRWVSAFAGLFLLAVLAVWLSFDPDSQFEFAEISVLPFQVSSSDEQLVSMRDRFHSLLVEEIGKTSLTIVGLMDQREAEFQISGSVHRELEDRAVFALRLIRGRDGELMWSRSLAVQPGTDGARQHARFIAATVGEFVPLAHNARRITDSQVAIDEYLKAWLLWSERAAGFEDVTLDAHMRHIRAAIAADPNYPLPYIAAGINYKNRFGSTLRWPESHERAHYYARKVRELLPEHTFLLGTINSQLDLDLEAAKANFEHERLRGMQPVGVLESEIGFAHFNTGKINEALTYFQNAQRLGSLVNRRAVLIYTSRAHLRLGDYNKAESKAAEALAEFRDNDHVWWWLKVLSVETAYRSGDMDLAESRYKDAVESLGEKRLYLVGVAALLGKPETRTLLQECEAAYVSGSESLVHFGSPFMARRI